MGETWVEDGLWKITINSVTETDRRDEIGEELDRYESTPGAVYIVNYTYENIGYEDEITDGLSVYLSGAVMKHQVKKVNTIVICHS